MDIFEENNLFYDSEEPLAIVDMNEYSTISQLSGNEESINLSAPTNDDCKMEYIDPSVYLNESYTSMDLFNSQASSSSQPYPLILKDDPMISANPNSVIPKRMWVPSDDSYQMQSSQESLLNLWNNHDSNNNNKVQENESGDKKRKCAAISYGNENRIIKKLIIPATTTLQPDISTPEIIEEALSLGGYYESKSCKDSSPLSPLIDVGKEEIVSIVKEEEILHENPLSVQSFSSDNFASSSNISTCPPSPSCSTSSNVTTPQKRRGRPPKSHSYRPNPEELEQLPESERKYREQRYKNNEASRQSRLNRKQKEAKERAEFDKQEEKYQYLSAKYATYENVHNQLHSLLSQLIRGEFSPNY